MKSGSVVRELTRIVGPGAVRSDPAQLMAYSFDATFQQVVPSMVVLPETTDHVAAILKVASTQHLPVVARGAATSLTGGSVPPKGALVLNLARMRSIKRVDPDDGVAEVEPGVITGDLHEVVERHHLFYPPDPASLRQCTIGGNLACNAGGPRCLKYGVTRDYVRGLTVVLADGSVLQTGGPTLKSSTGYALAQLFVGSEGTLGVITEATLRLVPMPGARATALAFFRSLDDATQTTTEILANSIAPTTLELFDDETLTLVDRVLNDRFPDAAEAALLIETDAIDDTSALGTLKRAAELARGCGAVEVRVATNAHDAEELWRARRSISGALGRIAKRKLGEDIVVPRSRIPEMVRTIRAIAEDVGLRIPLFGHAGDGNLHPNILFDPDRQGDLERTERAAAAIFEAAIAMGGALSGEHGVGTLKRQFLERNLGAASIDAMRRIKAAFDPTGILNPGKVFPDDDRSGWQTFLRGLPTLEADAVA